MAVSLSLEHIACCIDDSEASEFALAAALRMRALAPGRLSLIHVAPPANVLVGGQTSWEIDTDDPLAPPRRWLGERAGRVPGAEAVLLCGDPTVPVVAEWVRENGVGLVVAGLHHTRLQRTFLGSFARRLACESPAHVLIARTPQDEHDGRPWNVGCCIDEEDGSQTAMALTTALDELTPLRVSLVHVLSPPAPFPRGLLARMLPPPRRRERRGRELLDREAARMGDVTPVLLTGDPGPETCHWAARTEADLIVLGPRAGGRGGLGDVAAKVLAHAPCQVLLARPED